MKNSILLFLFIFLSFAIKAQTIVLEKHYGEETNDHRAILEFDKSNFQLISNSNDEKIYFSNPIETETQNFDQMVNFTLNLIPEGNGIKMVSIYNNENYYNHYIPSGQNNPTFSIEPGVYDILIIFTYYSTPIRLVIKEQISILENSNIQISYTEAKNKIMHYAVDENGNRLDHSSILDIGGWLNAITIEDIPNFKFYISNPLFSGHNGEPKSTFYCSNISERYLFNIINYTLTKNNIFYQPKYEYLYGINESKTVYNDQENWIYYEDKPIHPSILMDYHSYKNSHITTHTLKNGIADFVTLNYLSPYETNKDFKTMINPDRNNGISKTLVSFGLTEFNASGNYFNIHGNTISLNDDNQIQYGTENIKHNDFLMNNYLSITNNGTQNLPSHPKFTYFPNDLPSYLKYGDNVPILNTGFYNGYFIAGAIGRYGEVRESDFFNVPVNVYRDNELIFNNGYLNLAGSPLFIGEHEYYVKYRSENTRIQDMIGINSTELLFDTSLEDSHPPSLQMLQFRDSSNKIIHHFSADNEGVIRLAATDFHFDEELIFHYMPGNNVEVFYSLYDQNEWSELELTHYPEYFQTPKFGDYYEASLSSITPEGNDVWYDVKVICTDATGNKQIQTISPAFQLNSTLATEDVSSLNDLMVYPNPFTNHLYFEIPENLNSDYTLSITDFSGKQIHSQVCKANDLKKIDLSFLPKGIYIFSIEVDGKIVSKKVIKK
jgi:hypothetical protein